VRIATFNIEHSHRSSTINIESQRLEPLFGVTASLTRTIITLLTALVDMFLWPFMRPRRRSRALSDRIVQELEPRSAATNSPWWRNLPSHAFMAIYWVGLILLSILRCSGLLAWYCILGAVIDFPLALAEGFRGVPSFWGERRAYTTHVRSWTSGISFAAIFLVTEWHDAFRGLVMTPYEDYIRYGFWGIFSGSGKALIGLVTRIGASKWPLILRVFDVLMLPRYLGGVCVSGQRCLVQYPVFAEEEDIPTTGPAPTTLGFCYRPIGAGIPGRSRSRYCCLLSRRGSCSLIFISSVYTKALPTTVASNWSL